MNTTTFTQLSETDIRALLRAELESFFQGKFLTPAKQEEMAAFGGIELAVAVTQLKKPTIYALVQRREIPHMKKGKKLYFNREELKAWIESGRKPTSADIKGQAEAFMIEGRNRKAVRLR
jgi:excisionase family DNA binding protein